MDSILNRLKPLGFNLLLIVLISNYSYAFQYSVIKKNENLNGVEKFQQKKNPSMDKFSNMKKESRFQNSDQRFSNKTIRLETWDKHFSPLGQKKVFSDKSNSSFDQLWDKEIQEYKNMDIEESSWNQHLAKIHKDAGINLSQESQILDDKQSYNLVLQNMGYFEEMAEKMDLKSINRYQFRSNRPEGEIPVDNVRENTVSPN